MNAGLAVSILLLFIWGFLAGLFFILKAAYRYLLMQKINNLPTSKVRSAAVGLIELYGKAKRKKRMLSPISRKKCVYWKITAQYMDLIRNEWTGLYWNGESPQFYLEDDTGRILIEPKDAKLETPHDHVYQGYIKGGKVLWADFKKMDNSVIDFIKKLPKDDRKEFMDKSTSELRIFESYIAEDDEVYVIGDSEIKKDAKSHEGYKNLIVKNGNSKAMYITDSHERKIAEDMKHSLIKEVLFGLAVFSFFLYILLQYLMG